MSATGAVARGKRRRRQEEEERPSLDDLGTIAEPSS